MWQQIKTSPKDGTKIVIWSKRYDFCPIAHWGENESEDGPFEGWHLRGWSSPCCSCDDDFIGWDEDVEDGFMPTHWMPLPEDET